MFAATSACRACGRNRASQWYVIGHCRPHKAVRTFRVDRIAELTLLDQTVEIPAHFDVQDCLSTQSRMVPRP